MDRWLVKFLDETLEDRTDIPDTLPDSVRMSVLSVPLPGILAEKLPSPSPAPQTSPLPPYCFVTYTDSQWRLRGGWGARDTCTVRQCHGGGAACQVELFNRDLIPLQAVRAVGQLNAEGRLVAVWTVREHGYDGRKQEAKGET